MAPRQRPRGNAGAVAAVPGVQLPLRVPLTGSDEKKKGKTYLFEQFINFIKFIYINKTCLNWFEDNGGRMS